MSVGNGPCAHRWPGMGRCLELAVTTRPIEHGSATEVLAIYDVSLCGDHATFHDQTRRQDR